MAKAYFIGGAPRVGKSTLASLILEELPMASASTDDLRTALRYTTPAETEPDLYYLDSLNTDEPEMARMMHFETMDIIEAANRESAIVWPAVEAFVRKHLAGRRDVLVEGVAILPEFITELNFDYSVVFLGNKSPFHAGLIQELAKSNPDSWLGGLQPDTVDAYATFSNEASISLDREARKYHLPYFEMGGDFQAALSAARDALLN